MSSDFSRRIFLSGLLASASTAVFADAPAVSLRPLERPADYVRRAAPGADALIREANLGTGRVGYVVADANTGRVLEVMNPLLALPPASVAKTITALYGLDQLGAGYRFRTDLIATGPISNGRLNGDLILRGGGDPQLNTDDIGEMVRGLRDAGVREITGGFRIYDGALPYVQEIDASQPEHVGYNPSISGLNLNYNRVHFEWRRENASYEVTMDARAERYRPRVDIARMRIVDRDMPVYTYTREQGRDNWTVALGALGSGGSRWLPVRRPGLYAGEVFQVIARSHGIQLPDARVISAVRSGTVIVSHESDTLREVLRGMLRYSTNLTAEAIGLTASAAGGRNVGSLTASARRMGTWARQSLDVGQARFVDHSGLGDASRISARDMVEALVGAGATGPLRPLLKEIRLRDDEGNPVRNQAINIRAKTGTLNFVSALAGYARTPGGRDLAFAVFTADTTRRATIARADRERPVGARAWSGRSRRLQQALIERWAAVYEA